jgi:MFS family permease
MMVPGRPVAPPLPPPVLGPALPRRGEPGWTVWPRRVWPLDPVAAAPRRFVPLALAAAVLGGLFWRVSVLSIGYLLVGVLVFGVVYGTAERRPTRREAVGIVVTLMLLAVPAILAAAWLGVLCIAAAWLVGWTTLAGGRTWTAVVAASIVGWLVPARAAGWARRAVGPARRGRPGVGRMILVAMITAVLALVFGSLFAAADPAFARLVDGIVPEWHVFDAQVRVLVGLLVLLFVLGGGYLLRHPPRLDALAPARRTPVPNWEWAIPLAVLDVLFIGFVAVQAAVLFGGHAHVVETDGLTYAEYARQGFWQLLWVSALTLLVLSVVIRVAARETAADRRLVRVLVGVLCATSVVVVISAIHRMWLYQEAYGFSVQRIVVIAIELWLGAVFVLIALAGIRMSAHWLPTAVLFAGVVTLLGLAALDPERMIADRNVDRYEQTGQLDVEYLLRLSSDVQPALDRLPDDMQMCAVYRAKDRGPWYEFNLSRWRAAHDDPSTAMCPQYGEYSE